METAGQSNEWPKLDLTKIDPEFICKKCKYVMYKPHQADDCGCRYCYKCLDELAQSSSKCLSCDLSFASDSKIPDKFMQKKIFNLTVKCVEPDCDFTGKLIDYKEHYQIHAKKQENICSNCNKKFASKELLAKHLDFVIGDCADQEFTCPYEKLGCDLLKSTREESSSNKKAKIEDKNAGEKMDVEPSVGKRKRDIVKKHLEEHVRTHLDLLNISTEKNFDIVKKTIGSLGAELEKYRAAAGANFIDGIAQGDASTLHRHKETASYRDDSMEISESSTTSKGYSQDKLQQVEDLKIQLSLIDTAQKAFSSDITKLLKNYQLLKTENEKLRELINESKTQSQDLQKTLALTQVSMLALEERLINQEKVSYNGTLLWKITNVNERIQEAKQGRQTSFYSPPFYTSRNGFKMCARIYLNGDGNGRNTHLSLFFVLLRGESDSLLKWPFRQKVSFTLIDQSLSESKEHIIDAFRPDPNSSSFRRPTSEMNIASGLPLFCPLAKLMSTDHEYIKDNTMFIKIIVDVKDLQEI